MAASVCFLLDFKTLIEDIAFALNELCFAFPHCNPLSSWTGGYLFQRLQGDRGYSLKEHETSSLKRQNLVFSIVAGSIWFIFFRPWEYNTNVLRSYYSSMFRLNIFISKISNLLLTLGVKGTGDGEPWILIYLLL